MTDEKPNERYYDLYLDKFQGYWDDSEGHEEGIDAVVAAVRAESWQDCTEAEPCGYCQHGYRRGHRDATDGAARAVTDDEGDSDA